MQKQDYQNLRECPFCGGNARIVFKDMRFIGQNVFGSKKIKCGAKVICNRCHARGPLYTAELINPYDYNCQNSAPYIWMKNEAVNGWNRRANNG